MPYAHLLRNVSLFAQMNDAELDALASELLPQTFHKNQVLFQQGSTTNTLYIVKTGKVQIKAFGRNHEVTFTSIYGPDQYFGEFSLLDGLPRSAEAIALTYSELLTLTRPAFFRFLEHHPTFALKLLVTVSRRMRFAEAAVDHPVPVAPEEKIARILLEMAERYGAARVDQSIRLGLRMSADDLASLAGVTRDTANAILANLKASGLVSLERSHIVAVDPLRLRAMLTAAAPAAV
jgi:CRP-like cAMP-binding protein